MKKVTTSDIISTGLAIFSMFFGAGNLMYPIEVGMKSGSQGVFGIAGFIITAVLLPIAGLVGMILFNGDYNAFFNRLGKITGQAILCICFLVIGPLIAIPRIVTLSHTMIGPFLPIAFLKEVTPGSAFIFGLLFLGITFLATFRENRIVQLLGYVISPLLLLSLAIIIIQGILSADVVIPNTTPALTVFKDNVIAGYETLDLLGGIFFSSIILHILKNTMGHALENNPKLLASVSTKAGLIGVSLLGVVYIGMGFLGAFYGHNLSGTHPDVLFSEIAFKVVGNWGTALISIAVLMACFSTSIALAAAVAEYVQLTIFRNKISYVTALTLILALCLPLSIAGQTYVRSMTLGPLLYVGYPVIIALTFCNIAYKLFGFTWIKLPVLLTFGAALMSYFGMYAAIMDACSSIISYLN